MTSETGDRPDGSSDALVDSWDKQLKAMDERLRASGRKVTVRDSSEAGEYTVTIPMGRRPAPAVPASKRPLGKAARGKVSILEALPTLVLSGRGSLDLAKAWGADLAISAMNQVEAGNLSDDVRDELCDFFGDLIPNAAKPVWRGLMGDDDYTAEVLEYGGTFIVWAVDYGRAGYFLSAGDAKAHIFNEWGSAREIPIPPPTPHELAQEWLDHMDLYNEGLDAEMAAGLSPMLDMDALEPWHLPPEVLREVLELRPDLNHGSPPTQSDPLVAEVPGTSSPRDDQPTPDEMADQQRMADAVARVMAERFGSGKPAESITSKPQDPMQPGIDALEQWHRDRVAGKLAPSEAPPPPPADAEAQRPTSCKEQPK